MNDDLLQIQVLLDCVNYARIRVFNDLYSDMFYAVLRLYDSLCCNGVSDAVARIFK